ncbi:MAG: protein translocase subunit SecD [Firmicutes bacterium]|nr:protein translocase subunit SecD [Bacillota bacterium]
MKNTRLIAAVLIVILLIGGWYTTIFGAGDKVAPLKDHIKLGLDLQGGVYVVLEAQDTDATGTELAALMNQTQSVIEKRVNEMGLSNPVVSIEGEDRIRVELPGVKDAEDAIESIGKTAQLSFMTADGNIIVDGGNVKNAGVAINQQGAGYVVTLEFDSEGAKAFESATKAIVSGEIVADEETGLPAECIGIVLDDEMISYPAVSNVITGGNCQIEGNFNQEDATYLSALIRGGALPVELTEVQTSIVGPTLGLNSLQQSITAGIVGIILVIIIMLIGYRIMGLAASIALLVYCLAYLWILATFGTVLTLPGIAGMILSVGMAVDANVIIFARIKEEVRENGKTIRVATTQGFKRALATVLDSQITTLIAGVALFQFGSGDVRGFAVTLMIGIVLSIITATVVTNVFLQGFAESKVLGTKKLFGIKENRKVKEAL